MVGNQGVVAVTPSPRGEVSSFYLPQQQLVLAEVMPLLAGPPRRHDVAVLQVTEDLEEHIRRRQQAVDGRHHRCLAVDGRHHGFLAV